MRARARTAIPPPPLRRRGSAARWDAIVIGTGVGGSVAAALLARAGRRVLVLEKNAKPGGILASYSKHGFKMDTGSHLVSRGRSGPLGWLLDRLDLDRPLLVRHRIPVRSRGIFEIAAPATPLGLPRTAIEAARKLRLPARDRVALARLLLEVLVLPERALRDWDRRTLDEFVRRHTDHPGAYFLMSFLASIFFVLPPWEVSAGEAIRCLRWILMDYELSYVEGGMDGLIHALLAVVVRAGGEIAAPARAVAIRRAGDALEVGTSDGDCYRAPAVAANLAPADLLPLLERDAVPEVWAARARAIRPSGNAHQLKLALDRELLDEGCMIGGVSLSGLTLADLSIDLMRRAVGDIGAGRVSDPMAIYAPVPTNFDPSLAPPGHQLVVASIYGPTVAAPEDPPARWEALSLKAMAKVIPDMEKHLVFHEFLPIPAVARWMGKSSRGAICNGQVPGQVGRDRLAVQVPVPGLFLTGDGAGGRGVGTELAAASAMEAARAILGGSP